MLCHLSPPPTTLLIAPRAPSPTLRNAALGLLQVPLVHSAYRVQEAFGSLLDVLEAQGELQARQQQQQQQGEQEQQEQQQGHRELLMRVAADLLSMGARGGKRAVAWPARVLLG